MNLEFKKETLFEHFRISTTLSKTDLNRQFQMKPELRKELPHYIQILNNEQKLFIEELFNTFIDGKFYTIEDYISNEQEIITFDKKLAVFINLVRRFNEVVTKIKISGKTLDKLLNEIYQNKDCSCFKHSNGSNTDEIYQAVVESCLNEIQEQVQSIINSLDSKNVNSLYRIVSAITQKDIKEKFLNSFTNFVPIP